MSIGDLTLLSKRRVNECKLNTKTINEILEFLIQKKVQEAVSIKKLLEDINALKREQKVIWNLISKKSKKTKK